MSHRPLACGFVLVACAGLCTAADDGPPFKITSKRDDDQVAVKAEQDAVIFSVQSPTGISHMTIERTAEKWPATVVLRLHLRGLESFQVTNGKVQLDGSVSTQDRSVRVWKDGKEDAPLDAKSPHWMQVRILGNDGKPAQAIPLENGCFELKAPPALFEGQPKSITIRWIDFYRN